MIAAITCYKPDPLKRNWGSFKQMRKLADVLIVLCDGCWVADWESVTGHGVRIDEVVEVKNNLGWQDYANKLTLLSRATAHKANHLLYLDDDETLTVNRETLLEQIKEMESAGCVAIEYDKREVWDERHYRDDGVWGQKRKVVLQKNPLMDESVHWRGGHLERLHHLPLQCGDVLQKLECRLYHWGMSSPELRAARVKRYKTCDPNGNNRGYGYDYLQSEEGMILKEIPK